MTELVDKLKYGEEINSLIEQGVQFSLDIRIPENVPAFRYAFDCPHQSNHLPVYK